MDTNSNAPTSTKRWPAILLSIALVAVALATTRPWESAGEEGFGIVAQQAPETSPQSEATTSPTVGHLAPNFLLESFSGQPVRLSDLRGTPVFLNFWATWCIFCISEMPAMQQVADQYDGRLAVVGINVGEALGDAHPFVERNTITYTLLLDSNREVTKAYQVRTMPTSLFIDEHGVVVQVHYGVLTPPQMEEEIHPLVS